MADRPVLGFIGLGNIGGPMAKRMAQSAEAVVYDIDPAARARMEGLAEIAGSPAEVGRKATVVGICVQDDAQVEAVLCGEDGLLSGMASGGTVLVHSTVGLETIHRLAAIAAESGVDLVDAGVTGGAERAADGKLVTMIGGSDAAFERARLLAETFSSDVIHGGPLGSGIILKICNNVITYTHMLAAREGFGLLAASGGDWRALARVLRGNGGMNESMRNFLRPLEGAQPLASPDHARRLAKKDLLHASELGSEVGWDGPGISAVEGLLEHIFPSR